MQRDKLLTAPCCGENRKKLLYNNMTFQPDTIILGGGDYPSHPMPLQMLKEAKRVICCDGAAESFILNEGRTPWRIVGDGDSLPEKFYQRFKDIIHRIPEQDTNDQTKATRYAMSHGAKRIAYIGATGRREDHTLGNVSLLMDYLRMGLDVRMYTDHGIFIPVHDYIQMDCLPETQVSIFSFGAQGLHAEGLRYPLSDFTSWWQGTLNACVCNGFSVKGLGDFLIYTTYKQKL